MKVIRVSANYNSDIGRKEGDVYAAVILIGFIKIGKKQQ